MIKRFRCQDEGHLLAEVDLVNPVPRLTERAAPGEPMPYGECPECGSLVHPLDSPAPYFDGFEVHRVVALKDGKPVAWDTEGELDVEVADDDPTVPDSMCRWTLYGHRPVGGVEALVDFRNRGHALAAHALMVSAGSSGSVVVWGTDATDAADAVVRFAMQSEPCPLDVAQECRDIFELMRQALVDARELTLFSSHPRFGVYQRRIDEALRRARNPVRI